MTEDEFWDIIERSQAVTQDLQMFRLEENELNHLDYDALVKFEHHFQTLLDRSYTWDLWAAAYIINGGCSDDGFEYFRDWLISKGRSVFYSALENPETLIDVAIPFETEFESFRYIVSEVAEERFGKPLPMDMWIRPDEPAGIAWDEDTVEAKFPKLSAWIESHDFNIVDTFEEQSYAQAKEPIYRKPVFWILSLLSFLIGVYGFYQTQSQHRMRNNLKTAFSSPEFFMSVCESSVSWYGQDNINAQQYFSREGISYQQAKALRPHETLQNAEGESVWQVVVETESDRFLCRDKVANYNGDIINQSTVTLEIIE